MFIGRDNRRAAANVAARIRKAVARLADFPGLGRPGRVPGTRELVVEGTPYIVAYHAVDDQVEILRVLHGSRRWPGLLE
jgi:addiction module RelE/StbE family toxin